MGDVGQTRGGWHSTEGHRALLPAPGVGASGCWGAAGAGHGATASGTAGQCQPPGPPAPGQSVPLSPQGHEAGGHSTPRCPLPRASARHRRDPGMGHPPPPGPPTRVPLTILVTVGLQEKDSQSQRGSLGTCHRSPATRSRCWEPQSLLPWWGPVLQHPPEPGTLPGHTSVPAPVSSPFLLSASSSVPRLTPSVPVPVAPACPLVDGSGGPRLTPWCQSRWPQVIPSVPAPAPPA